MYSIKGTWAVLITQSSTGWGSLNRMPRIVSIREFYPHHPSTSQGTPPSPPPNDCQPPFLSFHISSQCFYVFLHSCSHIPASLLAKARLVRLWFLAIPLRLEQRWTVPRWAHWQLTGSVQGWLWSMDGWMGMSCWHALWSFSADGILLFCSPLACVD